MLIKVINNNETIYLNVENSFSIDKNDLSKFENSEGFELKKNAQLRDMIDIEKPKELYNFMPQSFLDEDQCTTKKIVIITLYNVIQSTYVFEDTYDLKIYLMDNNGKTIEKL